MRIGYLLLLLPPIYAQPALTPSPAHPGPEAGSEVGSYTITNSFEAGYRFTAVGGDSGLFRSVENYGNGLRLFGGNFTPR